MPTDAAAWLDQRFADLAVRSAPYTEPATDEIVIRNRAGAVNPLETLKQSSGDLLCRRLPYPAVLVEDIAGEVVEIGNGVTRFQVGDRVLTCRRDGEGPPAPSRGRLPALHGRPRSAGRAHPDTLAFEDAAVLPLAVSTAASALFQTDQLRLRHPTVGPTPSDEAAVVWGGSTSVGSNAIQLAVAAATGASRVVLASPSVSLDALPRRPGISKELVGVAARLAAGNIALSRPAAGSTASTHASCGEAP